MRILVMSLQAPYPPYDGGGIRTIEILKALGERHEVTFLGTFQPACDSPNTLRDHLLSYCKQVELVAEDQAIVNWSRARQLRDLFTYPPSRLVRFLSEEYIRKACSLLSKSYDVVICNTILTGQLFARLRFPIPRILDTIDVFGLMRQREFKLVSHFGLTQLVKFVDWLKTAHYERRVWRCFDGLIAISDPDAKTIRNACSNKPVVTLPTGVNIPEDSSVPSLNKKFDLLLVGKLDYSPNIDAIKYFHEQIMPLLLKSLPQIRIAIAGKNPDSAVQRIVGQCKNYALFGNVPSLALYYHQARVVVIPMRTGSGIKVKLLEALAYGVPVVTTSIGAFGIPVCDHQHVVIADDPVAFAEAVTHLLSTPILASTLATLGKRLVADQFAWNRIKPQYLQFVEKVASGLQDPALRRVKNLD